METKTLIIPMSEVPNKEVFDQIEMQLHRILKIVKKYPASTDNAEHLKEGLKFIESVSWRLKKQCR